MKIGVGWSTGTSGANYRAIQPVHAMQALGHEVVMPATAEGVLDIAQLRSCDVFHVYRLCDDASQAIVDELSTRGVAVVWDNDDDFSAVPEESPFYRERGKAGIARMLEQTIRAARAAELVTVPSEHLADRFRSFGIERVEVLENCPLNGFRPRRRHNGLVIGWVAGLEHQADAEQLGIPDVLRRIQERHPEVGVISIGVDLRLERRYGHAPMVPFDLLPKHMAGFDIGIAPIADRPHNHARSNIKVKEYAASGVPWLASALTPYAALGEEQGGRLVSDDGWFDALDELIRQPRLRDRLTRNGRSWAKTQRLDHLLPRWEAVFAEAVAAKRGS